MKRTYIIGGGPAGMMAAISAKQHYPHDDIILIERNEILGKKLKQTGGGRCNVTAHYDNQTIIEHIPKNGKFLFSSLHNFNSDSIQHFFQHHNCPLKIEAHQRVFPASNKSQDIIQTLHDKLVALGVHILFDTKITTIDPYSQTLTTSTGKTFLFDYVVLACGGMCMPQSGSDGIGYNLAKQLGHTITELGPAEVPLVSNDDIIQQKKLLGLSFPDISLTIYKKQKKWKTLHHDLLFTHFGLSGPVALRASYYIIQLLKQQKTVSTSIDFLPHMTSAQLLHHFKQAADSLEKMICLLGLPKRFAQLILVPYTHKTVLKEQDYLDIIQKLKKFPVSVYETRGLPQAFVTNGGISTKEINPSTMKSTLQPLVSFAGELIDINGFTGGFNITAALSTGFTAGTNLY